MVRDGLGDEVAGSVAVGTAVLRARGDGAVRARAGEGLIEALTARGREAREIRPGNEMGGEARRLYGQPATVEAPRKRDDVGPRVRVARPDENVG